MHRPNTLNAADFTSSSYATEALRRLNTGDWAGFELRDLQYAFNALSEAFRYKARNCNLQPSAPEWSVLRECLHALGDVFALKWLERGEGVFSEKLGFYRRKARLERAVATDELFYQALLRLDAKRQALLRKGPNQPLQPTAGRSDE